MKILSPAGNFECLKMAINNGADEVYLGINNFNARNNIDGFTLENLEEAVNYAHIFNVKINLAINILFSDNELQEALFAVIKAYNLGVDSFIIQDLALAKLLHDNYPFIDIHASTQMGIHNLEGVKYIEQFGFSRVVLARETPLDEIKRIRENSNIEIEYFAHGALCVCFSGNCYLSSYLLNASGNRGRCKQLCRLPYTLLENNKPLKNGYLLSAKDFNMLDKLNDLKTAGVDILKIEGRARRPYYVAAATKEYYNALNNLPVNETDLKLAFNRGFTPGYFDGNHNIISNKQNHIGIYIGKVEKVNNGKKFNEVYFSSSIPLSKKSSFKIFSNEEEKTTLSAFDLTLVSKNKYKLTTTQKLNINDKIHLIVDAQKEQEILTQIKKRDINIFLTLEEYKPIKAIVKLNSKTIEIFGETLESANKQPLSKEELLSNFAKSDIFNAIIEVEKLDNVFMQKQKLNEFRRNVFDKTRNELISKAKHNIKPIKINNNYSVIKFEDFQIVENIKEKLTAKNIVYSPSEYSLEDIIKFKEVCEKQNKNICLDTPNFALEKDIQILNNIIEKTQINIVANNYYALNFKTNIIIGAGLNVYNKLTASIFNKPIITAESDVSTRIDFPYMTLRHCPLKNHLNANCTNCPYSNDYSLKMDNGKILKLKRKKLSTCTFYLTD